MPAISQTADRRSADAICAAAAHAESCGNAPEHGANGIGYRRSMWIHGPELLYKGVQKQLQNDADCLQGELRGQVPQLILAQQGSPPPQRCSDVGWGQAPGFQLTSNYRRMRFSCVLTW